MRESKISIFTSGIQNSVDSEIIKKDASSVSRNWVTKDGRIELIRGRQLYGVNTTIEDDVDVEVAPEIGGVYSQVFAPRQDGVKVHYRKINNRIQVYDNNEWLDVISDLTDNSDVFFAPYASLAGNFLYIGSPDGLYKINVANPRSYKDMYDATVNHKGYILINESRMFLWNRFDPPGDKTALYLSKIDPQGTNYTQVSNEVFGTGDGVETDFNGTLVQATGKRFVFNISIVVQDNPSINATDDQNGNISGSGISGTINYATGLLDLVFESPVPNTKEIRVSYQYENSNSGGITDFTFSSPRVAGEGDLIPQEYLGEPILNVIPFDNRYYSFKTTSVYELDLTDDDTNATNKVYRSDIGIRYHRGIVATGKGIVYIDNSNPDKPALTILQRNPVGGNLEPINLTPLFAWENYKFDKCIMDTWGQFILVACRTPDSEFNNRLFLINTNQKYSVDLTFYGVLSLAKNDGLLYGGSSETEVVHQLFFGNDNLGDVIDNFWISKNENMGDDRLKKVRYLELKGLIDPNQLFEVYASYDNDSNILLGTVRGDADYVDLTNPQLIETGVGGSSTTQTVGGDEVGAGLLGGGLGNSTTGDTIVAYTYHTRIKIHSSKFRVRRIILIAKGFGFCAVNMIKDFDILVYEQRIPSRFRQKQYVSQDGSTTDNPTFQS